MACSTPPVLDGFETGEAVVDDVVLTVAVADSSSQRSQGLSGVEAIPDGLDGMLFSWTEPTTTSFHMRDVEFPLDVWFFDAEGALIGSARMEPCPDGDCVGYATPGPVMWALETTAGAFTFDSGSTITVED